MHSDQHSNVNDFFQGEMSMFLKTCVFLLFVFLPFFSAARPVYNSLYGKTNRPIHASDVLCLGDEEELIECTMTLYSVNDGRLHLEDARVAGVSCQGSDETPTQPSDSLTTLVLNSSTVICQPLPSDSAGMVVNVPTITTTCAAGTTVSISTTISVTVTSISTRPTSITIYASTSTATVTETSTAVTISTSTATVYMSRTGSALPVNCDSTPIPTAESLTNSSGVSSTLVIIVALAFILITIVVVIG